MSCYEWERGIITIPSKDWVPFRHCLVEAHNRYMDTLYNAGVAAYEEALRRGQGKRGFDYRGVVEQVLYRRLPGDEVHEVSWKMYPHPRKGTEKPLKPKRKDFPHLPKTTATSIPAGDGRITFVEGRRVLWDVDENNHACDHAREHPLGMAFFRALKGIKWVRGTGGRIVGNDEYNQEGDEPGDGGNYIKEVYGPRGKQAWTHWYGR